MGLGHNTTHQILHSIFNLSINSCSSLVASGPTPHRWHYWENSLLFHSNQSEYLEPPLHLNTDHYIRAGLRAGLHHSQVGQLSCADVNITSHGCCQKREEERGSEKDPSQQTSQNCYQTWQDPCQTQEEHVHYKVSQKQLLNLVPSDVLVFQQEDAG